jgi:glycosyltransferase involved in cell wall biosynthesis
MSSIPVSAKSSAGSDFTPGSATLSVLQVNSGNLYGGVESILATLARSRDLCPAMDTQFALCHEGRLSQELTAAGARVHLLGEVRISRPWTVWRARRKLGELLRREHFDVVICHMPWSLAVFGRAVQAAGPKLGFWAHSFHSGHNWLERLARRTRPDLAIGNSRFTESGLDNICANVPRGIVYPPVAVSEPSPAGQWRRALRDQYQVGEDTVVIIQVSRMEGCKGHALHLEALAQLQRLQTPWVCWMVGGAQRQEERQYLDQLQRTVAELGLEQRIQFLGQRSDIGQLLAAADIFCQPNQGPDSFGMVFVEALRAGLPVVSTALGGALEIVDESCGVLVKPGDSRQLAESLACLIESPELRRRLGSAGAARGLKLCVPSTEMKMLSDLCRRVAVQEPAAA